MRTVVLLFLLLLSASSLLSQSYSVPPNVPATAPNREFSLRVRIFGDHWTHSRGSYQGFGRGDLLGDKPTGFDYTYSCNAPFLHNAEPREPYDSKREDLYQARWKKENLKLELLLQKVGSDHLEKCELKIATKPVPYGIYATPAVDATPGTSTSVPPVAPNGSKK